jgi:GTP-binding protein EngB required for normal cell division
MPIVEFCTLQIAKKLRALPSVETSLPTLALVGAPNVGKSSLVRVRVSATAATTIATAGGVGVQTKKWVWPDALAYGT